MTSVAQRVSALDWDVIGRDLETHGSSTTTPFLTRDECDKLVACYGDAAAFRNVVNMQRHGFGSGEYKYFGRPLPELVAQLREALYPALARIANNWSERLRTRGFPPTLDEFLAVCHAAGQEKPTPLLLHYGTGDYNALHQDVYGEIGFPLQVLSVLTPAAQYRGGAVLLVTQRPRGQSVGEALTPEQGSLVVFPNRYRPVRGTRGDYRVGVRHGVSRLLAGERHTLGVIFHDAE
ncbi:MAG: proline hydroxylase [Actinomycetia bacterium]|nr:proline hydroxylase [Actinomycetes bacterium]